VVRISRKRLTYPPPSPTHYRYLFSLPM
jgi:hypothetical protein